MICLIQKHWLNCESLTPRFIVVFTLVAFLTMKAFVPPGFMPSDGSTSSFYMLCYGDPSSAQLITTLAEPLAASAMPSSHNHHTAHQKPASHTEHHSTGGYHESARHNAEQPFCLYAALLGIFAAISFIFLGLLSTRKAPRFIDFVQTVRHIIAYFLPAVRAPPSLLFSL